ncbi:MAG: class I tRNA ligase family protein, partial [Anaerolineales bacterium]
IVGARRFLNRIWNLYAETYAASALAQATDVEIERRRHKTIRQVTERIQDFRLNTMVSTFMEFVSFLFDEQRKGSWQTASFHQALETLLVLLAPAAPHICEELWHLTGHQGSVHRQPWSTWDAELAREQVVEIAVQVNGRLRDVLQVPAEVGKAQVEYSALSLDRVQSHIAGKKVVRTIYVPGKVINIITSK